MLGSHRASRLRRPVLFLSFQHGRWHLPKRRGAPQERSGVLAVRLPGSRGLHERFALSQTQRSLEQAGPPHPES